MPTTMGAAASRPASSAAAARPAPARLLDRAAIVQRFGAAFRVRPWIYWTDLLLSAGLGWAAFFTAVAAAPFSLLHLAASTVAVLALLRAALFIHELAHLKRTDLPWFEEAWDALVGIPVLVPSLMYVGSHLDHHRPAAFATAEDPEYAPIALWSRPRIALFVATVAFVPALLVLRWGVVGPLSRLFPPLRRLAIERLSTLVINEGYKRPLPQGSRLRRFEREEIAAACYVWAVAGGVWLGLVPMAFVWQWLALAAGILVLNQVRTLAAHGYGNPGVPVDGEAQLLDSINLRGNLLTALVAPVGLRFHALHHYLPSLPYHSLGRVHRALLAELPQDAPYRATTRGGLLEPVQKLWNEAAPVV